jgi:hypothetical protein
MSRGDLPLAEEMISGQTLGIIHRDANDGSRGIIHTAHTLGGYERPAHATAKPSDPLSTGKKKKKGKGKKGEVETSQSEEESPSHKLASYTHGNT